MQITVTDLALALLEHARIDPPPGVTSVTVEVSVVAGAPGAICRVIHHCDDYPRLLLVPLTEYYKASHRNRHILERLPLQDVLDEYNRLLRDALDVGVFPE